MCLVTVVRAANCRTAAEICGCVIFRIYDILDLESVFNLLLGVHGLMRLALIRDFYNYLVASRCML